MKKFLFIVLALAVALSFGAPAMAKDGLSVDLGFAWNFDGAGMTKTIVKDGEEGAGLSYDPVAGTYSGPTLGKIIFAENELLTANKDAAKKNIFAKVEDNGGMQGLNTSLRVRYNFLNAFFARVGFNYDKRLSGGETETTFGPYANVALGTAINDDPAVNGLIAANLSGLANGKVSLKWDYQSWAIPVTVGINIPINDGKYNVYAGLGLTYFSGYWEVEMEVPAGYCVEDFNPTTGALTASAAAKETVKFETSGIGFNWTIGFNAEIVSNVSLFVEWDAQVAGGMSDSVKLKSDAAQWGFGADNVFYPVNLSSSLIRFGVSYYIMAL